MRVKVAKNGIRWNGETFSGPLLPIGEIVDMPDAKVKELKANSFYDDHLEIPRGRKPKVKHEDG